MTVAMADKIAGMALSAGALAPALFTNDLTTPIIGVGITTVGGAILGTYAAIGYDDAKRPRGKLFLLASSTVIVGAALKKELEKDGATFALKAKLQAEVLLDESFKMSMDKDVDPRVRAKLIADTVRWAGFDKAGAAADATGGFNITINLDTGKKMGDLFEGEAEDV